MTLPVCPACRTSITLDTHVCGRCGLAVRPTCGNCGEPLSMDMRFCPRCGVPLDAGFHPTPIPGDTQPLPSVAGPAAVAVAPTQQFVARQPEYHAPPPSFAPRRRRRRARGFFRFLFISLISGVLVAAALVALELATRGPGNPPPDRIDLVRRDFPASGYSVEVPKGWRTKRVEIGGRPAYSFADPKRTPDGRRRRGMSIGSDRRPLGAVAEIASRDARGRSNVTVETGLSVGGHDALLVTIRSDDTQFDRWWIDRGETTLRIEFSSTLALAEETSVLEDRIIDGFQIL